MDAPDHTATRETESQKCPRCDYTWDVLGLTEYGSWTPYDENDLICPDCGRCVLDE